MIKKLLAVSLLLLIVLVATWGLAKKNTLGDNLPSQQTMQTPVEKEAALLAKKVMLGRQLFFDERLSEPPGQSCAGCHDPSHGFADSRKASPASEGAVSGRFPNRNTPTIAYSAFSPAFYFDEEEQHFVGGQFHDGRAVSLHDQAIAPLTGPLEMNNPDMQTVVNKLIASGYNSAFNTIYGNGALEGDKAADFVVDALSVYEGSDEVNPFSSKYDAWLAGKATLTPLEQQGLELFEAEDKGNCAACHPSRPADDGTPPLFTDFTYDNVGIPANSNNPFLLLDAVLNPDGLNAIDLGLGGVLNKPEEHGKFKVSTLRNIEKTAPYMHNGFFESLEDVMRFYNRRDLEPEHFGAPEVAENVNTEELGDLKLTAAEERAIVAFMKTLTDGFVANSAD